MKHAYFPCGTDPYTLPTIGFVGGTTETLVFYLYNHGNEYPFDLSQCTASFSMVSYLNKMNGPLLTKSMTIEDGDLDGKHLIKNRLKVVLAATETVNLFGKYIYQITVKERTGTIEIPNQGIMFITNNIDKALIR